MYIHYTWPHHIHSPSFLAPRALPLHLFYSHDGRIWRRMGIVARAKEEGGGR